MTWEDVIVAGLLGTSTGGAGEDSAGSAITDSLLSWNGPSSRLSSFMAGNEASSDSTLPSGLNRGGGGQLESRYRFKVTTNCSWEDSMAIWRNFPFRLSWPNPASASSVSRSEVLGWILYRFCGGEGGC